MDEQMPPTFLGAVEKKPMAGRSLSKKNQFDRILKFLTSLMPRRQAIQFMASIAAGVVLESLWPRRVSASENSLVAKGVVLKLPVADLVAEKQELPTIIEVLQKKYNAPVSYIQHHSNPLLSVHVKNGSVQDALDQIVRQNSIYKWLEIDGRVVIFPNAPRFEAIIKGVNIANIPREASCFKYIIYLRAYSKDYLDFGVGMGGDQRLPIFTELVTLSRQAALIHQLVELLGDNPAASFNMEVNPWDNILQLGLDQGNIQPVIPNQKASLPQSPPSLP